MGEATSIQTSQAWRFFLKGLPPPPKNLALTQKLARFEKEMYLLKSYHLSNPWEISRDH